MRMLHPFLISLLFLSTHFILSINFSPLVRPENFNYSGGAVKKQNLLTFAASLARECTIYTEQDPDGAAYMGLDDSSLLCAFPMGDKWSVLTRDRELLVADYPPEDAEEESFYRVAAESALSYPPAAFLEKRIAQAEPPVGDASESMLRHYHEWWLEAHPFFRREGGPYLQVGGYAIEWDENTDDGELQFLFFDGKQSMVEVHKKGDIITIYSNEGQE